jgi:hypothetical protein
MILTTNQYRLWQGRKYARVKEEKKAYSMTVSRMGGGTE